MRPRVFPAEDVPCLVIHFNSLEEGFNEAAGIPRGRHIPARVLAVVL